MWIGQIRQSWSIVVSAEVSYSSLALIFSQKAETVARFMGLNSIGDWLPVKCVPRRQSVYDRLRTLRIARRTISAVRPKTKCEVKA